MIAQWLILLPVFALAKPTIDLSKLPIEIPKSPYPVASPSHYEVRYLSGNNGYGYVTDDHYKVEVRNADGSVQGVYGYKMPDGKTHVTSYVSDKKGYRLVENDVLQKVSKEGTLFHQFLNDAPEKGKEVGEYQVATGPISIKPQPQTQNPKPRSQYKHPYWHQLFTNLKTRDGSETDEEDSDEEVDIVEEQTVEEQLVGEQAVEEQVVEEQQGEEQSTEEQLLEEQPPEELSPQAPPPTVEEEQPPKQDYAVASPGAVAIAGDDGIAQTQGQATAVVGPNGLAIASPAAASYSGKKGASVSAPGSVAIAGPGGVAIADPYSLAHSGLDSDVIEDLKEAFNPRKTPDIEGYRNRKPQPIYFRNPWNYNNRRHYYEG